MAIDKTVDIRVAISQIGEMIQAVSTPKQKEEALEAGLALYGLDKEVRNNSLIQNLLMMKEINRQ